MPVSFRGYVCRTSNIFPVDDADFAYATVSPIYLISIYLYTYKQ
jgi:hypothetical protein